MTTRIALLGATAVGLLLATGAAYADGNKAYLTQNGSGNSASITQKSGATTGNQAGTASENVTQTGPGNTLTIVQDGDEGTIGVATGTVDYYTPDYPTPPNPQFSITYAGVDQISTGSGSNTATLTEHDVGAVIGELQQTAHATANGNDASAIVTGENAINHIWQVQEAGATATNVANLTVSGSGNQLDRVDQRAKGAGTPNQIIANIAGNDNGVDDFSGTGPFYTSRAWLAGGTPSALIQNNYGSWGTNNQAHAIEGNYINLTISGNNNLFGMTQKGADNTAGLVTISGSSNKFGSYQEGDANVIGIGQIAGSGNDVGIWQSGTSNQANVSVLAFGSDFNQLSVLQQGSTHVALVEITGSNNGEGSLAGVAGTLVSNNSSTMGNGTILQGDQPSDASNNTSLTIFGNGNKFALTQLGSNNDITGTIGLNATPSPNNSVAVLQTGSSNVASFSQQGGGSNVAAISQ